MLMDRIKIKSFLDLPPLEQILIIEKVQALRRTTQEEERIKKGGVTKTARKRGKKTPDPTAKLQKLMKSLPPEALAKLKQSYGVA